MRNIFVTTCNYSEGLKQIFALSLKEIQTITEISMMTLSKEKRDGDSDDLYRWLESCQLLSGVSQSQRSVRTVTGVHWHQRLA